MTANTTMEQKTVEYQIEPLAQDIQDVRSRHEANRVSWNQGAQRYTEELEDTIEFLRVGNSNLHPVERRNLGDLRAWCRTAIHLQCASGRDTLSLWNEGVSRVIGVDISDVHIANARRITEALQAPATPGIAAMCLILHTSLMASLTWYIPAGGRCAGYTI